MVSHLVSHLTLHWALRLGRADNHGTQYTVTHHPFTVGSGTCSGGWLGCEWVTDQAHSRKEMIQSDIFKSAGQTSVGTGMPRAIGISGLPSEDASRSKRTTTTTTKHQERFLGIVLWNYWRGAGVGVRWQWRTRCKRRKTPGGEGVCRGLDPVSWAVFLCGCPWKAL